MASWNPWHGCHKISPGCQNCYVYRTDERHNLDASVVRKTGSFNLPVRMNRLGGYKIPAGSQIETCFTSDFFVEEADQWRDEAWRMIKKRPDCDFFMITKRIHRFMDCIPPDWGDGWDHVAIYCTCENQEMADFRLPIYKQAPLKHKGIICAPILGPVDFSPYLGDWVEEVSVGGESGNEARPSNFDWVLDIKDQCVRANVTFTYHQTGARLIKDGKMYRIKRPYQHSQARKAGIGYWRQTR